MGDDPEWPLRGVHDFCANPAGATALSRRGPYPAGNAFVDLVYQVDDSGGPVNESKRPAA